MGGLNLNLVILGGWSSGSSGALAATAIRVEMLRAISKAQRPKDSLHDYCASIHYGFAHR
jgi:hypothetical protein